MEHLNAPYNDHKTDNNSYSSQSLETPSDGMINFEVLVNALSKWFWAIIITTTLITALTALILFRLTPIYKASTILEIKQEERTILDVSQIENVIADKEFLATQVELLKGRSLSQNVVLNLNLLQDRYFHDPDDKASKNLTSETKLRKVETAFRENLSVSSVGRSRLIRVSFDHPNPNRAAQIANAITETYINNSLSTKFNSTAYAREFLEERLSKVKGDLGRAEREFFKYAQDNQIITIGNNDGNVNTGDLEVSALVTLSEELTKAQSERTLAEADYVNSLNNQFDTEILINDSLNKLKSERTTLNAEYIEKLAKFKPGYPDMIELKNRIDLFDTEIERQETAIISAKRGDLKTNFDLLIAKENSLKSRVAALKSSVLGDRETGIDYNILKREVEIIRAQYEGLLQRLKEISNSDDVGSNLVQIIDPAQVPIRPYKPNKLQALILAFLLSFTLSVAVSYLKELLDDKVKTPGDVTGKLKEIIMGVIPVAKNADDIIDIIADPQSGISEAYASLRTNLSYSGVDGGPRFLQVTSTRSGEGKSTSSFAIALRYAGVGHSVILIDADLRRPTFIDGTNESVGLSGLLTTRSDIKENIQVTTYDNLDLLPSGHLVPNPSELLSSARFDEIIEYARENYDYVIMDSPPVLGLADAPIIGAKADAALMIVESGELRTPNVRESIGRLKSSGTKVLGVALTKFAAQRQGYMDYYKYSYGEESRQYGTHKTKGRKKTKVSRQKKQVSLSE